MAHITPNSLFSELKTIDIFFSPIINFKPTYDLDACADIMFVGCMHNYTLNKEWPQVPWLPPERCVQKDPACARKIHTTSCFPISS